MSYICYDGRNVIARGNSKAKCLLENYVEERAVAEIDAERTVWRRGQTSSLQSIKDGHKGLLTTNTNAATLDLTTHLDAFRPFTGPYAKTKGNRRQLREQMLFEQAIKEVDEQLNALAVDEMISTAQQDYTVADFETRKPAPTTERDYTKEQPVTFWTEHRDKIHSVTQVKPTFDTCFRKNTKFSRPISERWEPDDVVPGDRDHVPNM